MNFEKVEQHLKANNADEVVKDGKLKEVYFVAKPILQLLAKLPIIPKKWRAIINSLIIGLDAVTDK